MSQLVVTVIWLLSLLACTPDVFLIRSIINIDIMIIILSNANFSAANNSFDFYRYDFNTTEDAEPSSQCYLGDSLIMLISRKSNIFSENDQLQTKNKN